MATIVQTKVVDSNVSISTGTTIAFDSPVTAGNTVVVALTGTATASSFGVSDSIAGTYTTGVNEGGSARARGLFYKQSHAGGSPTITITATVVTTTRYRIFELSGLDPAGPHQIGLANTGTNTTTHPSAASVSGSYVATISGTGFAVAVGLRSGAGAWTPDGAYTAGTNITQLRMMQYRIGTLTADVAPFTTVDLTVSGCAILFLPDAAGGPPGAITDLSGTAISSTQVDLTWTAASGATSHRVERATVP
jgi:hypothetical protein